MSFQYAFGKQVTVIIDCFEVFIERADRGFTICESVGLKQAKLVIPAFTKGKSQLHPVDVTG